MVGFRRGRAPILRSGPRRAARVSVRRVRKRIDKRMARRARR